MKELRNPFHFAWIIGQNFFHNGKSIGEDIFNSVFDLIRHKYYDFGFKIGESLGLILNGSPANKL